MQAMGISLSNLKKLCRNLGIRRWPQRKLQSLENMKQAILGDTVLTPQQKEVCGARLWWRRRACACVTCVCSALIACAAHSYL